MQVATQACNASWTSIGSCAWSLELKNLAKLGPSRVAVSFVAWVVRAGVAREYLSKVHSSVADAANCRISELRSWSACMICAPENRSTLVRNVSRPRKCARSSSLSSSFSSFPSPSSSSSSSSSDVLDPDDSSWVTLVMYCPPFIDRRRVRPLRWLSGLLLDKVWFWLDLEAM